MACMLLRSARLSSAIFIIQSDTHSSAWSEMPTAADLTDLRANRKDHDCYLAGVSFEDTQRPGELQLLSVCDRQLFDPVPSSAEGLQSRLNTFALLSAQLLPQTFSKFLQRQELNTKKENLQTISKTHKSSRQPTSNRKG